jgi:hypothetical protein
MSTTLPTPQIQIRKLAVNRGELISFFSIVALTLVLQSRPRWIILAKLNCWHGLSRREIIQFRNR